MQGPIHRTLLALVDAEVAFVVCGGVACVLQGVQRATHDLDVRVRLDDDNLRRLLTATTALGLRPRIPEPPEALLDPERRRVWVEEKHAVVYTLFRASGAFALDVFLVYPIGYDELMTAADTVALDGRNVSVSSRHHLIAAKRAVTPPRTKDLRDIEDLENLDG